MATHEVVVHVPVTASGNGATVAAHDKADEVEQQPMSGVVRVVIATALVVVAALLFTQIVAIWPAVAAATSNATPKPAVPATPFLFGVWRTTFDADAILIVLVVLTGGLAALVAASRRFLDHALRDDLTKRDEWSYLLRPFQGAALALIVYFALRAGYIGQNPNAPLNPYGVAAIAAFVGLFTRHALDALRRVFDVVLGQTKEDAEPVKVKPAGT